jgi:hypothetical protein
MGFSKVGVYHQAGYKLNKYRDVGWWELFIGDKNKAPAEIIPVKTLEGSEKFNQAIRSGMKYLN